MNLYAILATIALVGAMTGGAYWQGRTDGANGEIATQKREEDVARVAGAAAAASAAEAISRIEVRHVTIRQALETQVREVPVLRDCRAPDGVVRQLNAALTGSEPAAPAGVMPSAGGNVR